MRCRGEALDHRLLHRADRPQVELEHGHEGEDVRVSGDTAVYTRPEGGSLAFRFCASCGCVTHWRGLRPGADGRRRLAVNLRLVSDPDRGAAVPIDHFDGLATFEDLPRDGRCVGDMWF
jgi:hypothetical protein